MSWSQRPENISGETTKVKTSCGNLYLTVNYTVGDEGMKVPFEVFIRVGKAGGCAAAQSESIGRLISVILRHNPELDTDIVKQLSGVRCHLSNESASSCADAVAKMLKKVIVGWKEEWEQRRPSEPIESEVVDE